MSFVHHIWAKKQFITPSQKLLLWALADRAGDEHSCWPSSALLSEETSLSRATIFRSMNELVELKLITRTEQTRSNGSLTSNLYIMNIDLLITKEGVRKFNWGDVSVELPSLTVKHPSLTMTLPPSHPDTTLVSPCDTQNLQSNLQSNIRAESVADAPSRPKKIQKHKVPEDFQPNEGHQKSAQELGLNLNKELEAFKDYHLANGTIMADWSAGLRNWLRRAKEFKSSQRSQFNSSAPPAASNGLASGKLGYTDWWKNDCRERFGRWTNSYTLIGEPEEIFRKRYQEYLKQG